MKDNDQGMFLINSDPISSLFVSEVLFEGILGTTRVRKGMLGSLPPGLLTPTIPCCNTMEHSQGIMCYGD